MEEQLNQQLQQLEQSISQATQAEQAYQLLLEKLSIEDRLARIDN
jgi:cell division protein FtsL